MWGKIGFLLTVIFFILLNPGFVHAEEMHVNDEETLNTALEEASDGDIIILEEGEYHGNFVIEDSIEFKGKDGARIIGPDTGYPLIIEADDVVVKNLHVEGGASDAAGIFSRGDRNKITNNTINNVFHGILVRDGHSNTLSENKISSWDDSSRSYGYAMYVINGDGAMISHNETYDTQDGVWVSHSTSAIIHYNRFINARYGIHTMYADNIAIAHNEVRGSHNGGMIMESNNITIKNNYFHLNTTSDGAGIFGYDLFDSVIADNIILGNARGIFLSYAQRNEIYRNDITENVRGMEFGDGGTNNTVYYNNFTKNTQQVVTNPENENEFNYGELGNFWDDQNILDLNEDGKNDFAYKSGDVFYQMIERDPFLQIFFDSPTVRLWNTIEQYTHIPSDTHVIDEYSLAEPVDITPQVEVYVPEGNQMEFSNPAILTGLFVTTIAVSGFTIFITRRRKI